MMKLAPEWVRTSDPVIRSPSRYRWTTAPAPKLRRNIATMSQLAELNETGVDWLARHLGHDIRVHREYYRLQTSTITLAKVSKMLIAVDMKMK